MNNNKSTRNTEAELLAGLKLERKFAFDQLYHLHSPVLFTYLLKILNDADIADEILQEVFVKIWEKREIVKATKFIRAKLVSRTEAVCILLLPLVFEDIHELLGNII